MVDYTLTLIASPRRRGLSTVRPEINAKRFIPSATGGKASKLV
jgi:hypothetical protein